jgi:type I restriction enzyme S subunit
MGSNTSLTEYPFEEVIDFQEGPGILAKDFRENGVPLIRLSGLKDGKSLLEGCNYLDEDMVSNKWSHFRLHKGDVLLSTSATLGRVAIVDEKAVGSIAYTGIIRMRPRSKQVIPEFIPYLLHSPHFQQQCEAMGVGSVIRHFGPSHLRQMTVRLPEVTEQRAIAHILGTLDDKIELNRRMNETLEGMARAIFKSWFVDFDPVVWNAVQAGNPVPEKFAERAARYRAGTPAPVPEHIAALFPNRFLDSQLGPIPEGWGVKRFREFVIRSSEKVGEREVPEYSSTNEGLKPREETFKKQLSKSKSKNKLIRKHDLVFGLSRRVLNFGLMRDSIGAVSPVYNVFSIDASVMVPDFVERYMRERMHIYMSILNSSSREGQSIAKDKFLNTSILVPPRQIQERLRNHINAILHVIEHNEFESKTLAALRDTLLPKLISGELRVPEVEKFLQEAGL